MNMNAPPQQNAPPPNQAPGTGILPPRFQNEGDISLDANYGYNNQTKAPVKVEQ